MREAFAEQLAELETRIENELDHTSVTLATVGSALAGDSDQQVALIAERARELRDISHSIDSDLVIVTARQAPVASDLRLVLALIQLAHHGTLIANQFELVSEQLTAIDPTVLDRQRTATKLTEMAKLAGEQIHNAVTAFASRDLARAKQIDRQDDAIDRLNRQVFEVTLELDAAPDQRELALRYILIARSLERIGDNAVDIAEQAAFLITAELHEFSDASEPKTARTSAPEH
jgi:phosphate transport system protein